MKTGMHLILLMLMATVVMGASMDEELGLHSDGGNWRFYPAQERNEQLPDVLLIGDSIMNGYRSPVIKGLQGIANVDCWLTPMHLNSKQLHQDLAKVASNRNYAVIHFNIGLHGWQEGRIPKGTYQSLLEAYVAILKTNAPKAKLIWASTTQVHNQGTQELDETINPIIIRRNRIAESVMKAAGIRVNDLYGLMSDKLALVRGDKWHWQQDAYAIMAQQIKENILDMPLTGSSSREAHLEVDWPSFIAEQDLHWQSLPQLWDEAPFIGNGQMGSMLFQQDDHHLVIQIGRGDVQEHRAASGIEATGSTLPDSSRVPVGYFTLNTVGALKGCKLRLNLWDAEITGSIATDKGKLDVHAFIHSNENLLVVKSAADAGEAGFSFTWHPEKAFCPRVKGKRRGGGNYRPDYTGNPDPVVEEYENYSLCVQSMTGGGQTATAWAVRKDDPQTQTLYASVEHSFPEENAKASATASLHVGLDSKRETLLRDHRMWWHGFYPKSFVSLPDARMESFLWIQHYKMACATKGGKLLADNQGVWLQPTGWPALWWNLNVQLAYSHLLPANHPELSVGLTNQLYKYRENLGKNVPERMRGDSMGINVVSGQDLISPVGDPSTGRACTLGNLTWALHNCYMQYRYTMDKALLRDKIFPLLKGAINTYRHVLYKGDDGTLHLPATDSPEYGNAPDCNYDLALLRWGCQALVDSCAVLDMDDPLLPQWRDILARLTDYPQDETGFMIGKDTPYAKSHRHYSHLLMFYPLSTLDLDDPGQRALALKSLKHWQSYPKALAGYSYTGSSSMYSLLGDGKMAEQRLQDFFQDKILPNTFYKEGSPVIETPLAAARAIEDMLIQSWGDRIRVFPAIPDKWSEVAFADLRTEGAFLVSAVRKQGKTAFIKIKSLAGEPCRIQTGIAGDIKVLGVDDQEVKQLGNGVVEFTLPKNEQAILVDASYGGSYSIKPIDAVYHADGSWGK